MTFKESWVKKQAENADSIVARNRFTDAYHTYEEVYISDTPNLDSISICWPANSSLVIVSEKLANEPSLLISRDGTHFYYLDYLLGMYTPANELPILDKYFDY